MQLAAQRHPGAIVLGLTGRIDHRNADDLRAALAPWLGECAAGASVLVLDLSALEYVSSAGLRILMLAARETRPRGGRILLAAPGPVVAEILAISHFDMAFPVHPTVDAALAAAAP